MATTATYQYRVRNRAGQLISGQLEAETSGAVALRLREMGYAPISIDRVDTSGLKREITIPGLEQRIKLKDLAVFSRQFATMIGSGLALLRALQILERQTQNERLADVLGEVRELVESGSSLSQALADHDDVFPRLYISMVKAGETAGMLDTVLLRIADSLEKEVTLRGKIKSAMTYPVVVFVMAVLLTSAMLIFIVPTFAGMFDSLGGELPLPTKMLMAASNFLASFAGLAVFVLLPVGAWFGFKAAKRNERARYEIDRWKLRIPVFGDLFHKIAMSRFARNLSTLLHAGVPILQSLEITAATVNNELIASAIDDVQGSVRQGESMAEPLTKHEVFPPMVVQMIAVGEETGTVDTMLGKISDFYDREIEATTESLTALIEPIMIAVLGGIVGSMVIAMYLPMFGIFELIE